MSTDQHGYVAYTHGCRCDTCRKAKADYMRARRAKGRALARHVQTKTRRRYVAPIEAHGTRYGYEERGCRCIDCTDARTAADTARRHRRIAERTTP